MVILAIRALSLKIVGLILVFCCLAMPFYVVAQRDFLIEDIEQQLGSYRDNILKNRKTQVGYSVGFAMELGSERNGVLRAYANIGFLSKVNNDETGILIGGQSHIEFYRGGLGTSQLNSEKFKINIELRNSIATGIGFTSHSRLAGRPFFVNVGSDASSLIDPLDYSISLGTMFINGINHNRHQRIGTLSLSLNQFSFHYYNDGPPFSSKWLKLSDAYDRYWTGGGQLGFYFKNNKTFFTDWILRFDNYTGYQLNLYEVGSILQIDYLPYKVEEKQMFNQARFQYKFGIRNSIYINGAIYEPVDTDIQNLIHYHISISPFHPRPLDRRITLGLEYNYNLKFH